MRNADDDQTTQWRFTEQMGADDATAQISLPPSDETTVISSPTGEQRVYASAASPGGAVPSQPAPAAGASAPPAAAAPGTPVGVERGRTTIASEVVEQVVDRLVQLAVADTAGVVGLHPGVGRFFGEEEADAGEQSVAVRIEDREAAINIAIEVEFGHPVHEAVEQVRASVIESAERLLGLTVTEVNVAVTGVAFPSAE